MATFVNQFIDYYTGRQREKNRDEQGSKSVRAFAALLLPRKLWKDRFERATRRMAVTNDDKLDLQVGGKEL